MKFDETRDKPLRLPIIAVSREKQIEILNTQKQPKTFSGFTVEKNERVSVPINVIPIQIAYQIDIYTKGLAEADEYLRNFVFNFVNYPKIVVELPYNNVKLFHESIIHLDPSISDNSDIREHLFADQFARFTLKISIDDAYLFSVPVNASAHLDYACLEVLNQDVLGQLEVIDRHPELVAERSPIWMGE